MSHRAPQNVTGVAGAVIPFLLVGQGCISLQHKSTLKLIVSNQLPFSVLFERYQVCLGCRSWCVSGDKCNGLSSDWELDWEGPGSCRRALH